MTLAVVLLSIIIVLALSLYAVLATKSRSPSSLVTVSIPRRIVMTWKTAIELAPKQFQENYAAMRRLHPSWDIVFMDDAALEKFMTTEANEDFQSLYNRCALRIQQIDIFRMAYVCKHGGFYLDCDFKVTQPLDSACSRASAVFPQELDRNTDDILQQRGCEYLVGNYAFGAVPGHPVFEKYVAHALASMGKVTMRGDTADRRRVFYTTGPVAVTVAVLDALEEDKGSVAVLKGNGNAQFGEYGVHQLAGTWKKNTEKVPQPF